ncbi:hypothetical protein GBAR_LOCUS2143 [Geodia barretti]|uniref:Uncharacterized protein n=1 Tax=Geodia barretti TaxID=519541 RepID=A0AA35W6E4_GEOBA|nr:hypothetical protein GBAR_LOCUS2143 [Geodia barretti]
MNASTYFARLPKSKNLRETRIAGAHLTTSMEADPEGVDFWQRGDSYGYDYSGGEDEPEDAEGYGALTGQLTSYEEAYNVGQKVLLAGQAASMHARDRHYPRSYDSEGYAADSTDSTEVDMSVYGVRYYT